MCVSLLVSLLLVSALQTDTQTSCVCARCYTKSVFLMCVSLLVSLLLVSALQRCNTKSVFLMCEDHVRRWKPPLVNSGDLVCWFPVLSQYDQEGEIEREVSDFLIKTPKVLNKKKSPSFWMLYRAGEKEMCVCVCEREREGEGEGEGECVCECVCACVCVCVRERERERLSGRNGQTRKRKRDR